VDDLLAQRAVSRGHVGSADQGEEQLVPPLIAAVRLSETATLAMQLPYRRGLPRDELYRHMFNPKLYLLTHGLVYAKPRAR
jgi:hypothetical protein